MWPLQAYYDSGVVFTHTFYVKMSKGVAVFDRARLSGFGLQLSRGRILAGFEKAILSAQDELSDGQYVYLRIEEEVLPNVDDVKHCTVPVRGSAAEFRAIPSQVAMQQLVSGTLVTSEMTIRVYKLFGKTLTPFSTNGFVAVRFLQIRA